MYRLWSDKRYDEALVAYQAGRRGGMDPKETWYNDQLEFFDKYVLPLTEQIKQSGIFGDDSKEYYSYALSNRERWERQGKDIMENRTKE